MRIILDTSAYSHAMRGFPSAVSVLRKARDILVCPVVIGELLAGFKRGSREGENREGLREFLARERVRVVGVGEQTAEFYALIIDRLRGAGSPIPTNDIWIGASAMEHGAAVATADAHFTSIDGLLVEDVSA